MPSSAASRSRSASRRRHAARRPQVLLTSRGASRRSPDHRRRRSRSNSPPRHSGRPSSSTTPAADSTGLTLQTLTTAPPSDRSKKVLPTGVVRTREIPGNQYEYTVTVDGVDYKTCSAFYCTLCHAQLHNAAIEAHVASRRHKCKIATDDDDTWETDSRPSATLPLAGSQTQPLSQFQSAGYMGSQVTSTPPALPAAPQPVQPTLPPQMFMAQPSTAPQPSHLYVPPQATSAPAPLMTPPAQPLPAPAPMSQLPPAMFPPRPAVMTHWTEDEINNLFSSTTFRARLQEFVVNLSGNRSYSVVPSSVLDRIPTPPAPRR